MWWEPGFDMKRWRDKQEAWNKIKLVQKKDAARP